MLPRHLLSLEGSTIGDYQMIQLLGYGSFGGVYKAKAVGSSTIVACKVGVDYKSLDRESEIVKSLAGYGNFLQWIGRFSENGVHVFVMEFGHESLEKLKGKNVDKKFGPSTTQKICHQVICGLEKLHSLNITHRDMKLGNLLATVPSPLDMSFNVKIVDFGLSHKSVDENGNKSEDNIWFTFKNMFHASPYVALGDSPKELDDLIQVTYLCLRSQKCPVVDFEGSAFQRQKTKSLLLNEPRNVLSSEYAWMCSFLEAVASFKPNDPIDYNVLRESIVAMLPNSDPAAPLFMELVDGINYLM